MRLLPSLLLQLQQLRGQQQQYMQHCAVVLSACATCGVQLLPLWGELLSPLLEGPAALEGSSAAAATPWGAWLLSQPLLDHVRATAAAGLLCGLAAVGEAAAKETQDLLRAAAAAAAGHAAASVEGFLGLLASGSSSSNGNWALRQLTDEALGDLTRDVCCEGIH